MDQILRPSRASADRHLSSAAHPGAVWAVSAMIGVMFMGSTLVTPLYVLYRQAFGFSEITLTLVYAAYVVGNLAAVLFFGRLSDQFGRRRTVLPAMGLAAISSLAFLFAQGTAWLFAGRIILGFAVGVSAAAGAAWLAELDTDKPHATLMATGGNFAGIAIGPALAGLLAEYGPWPLQLPHLAYLACVATIAAWICRTPETRRTGLPPLGSLRPRVGVPPGIRAQFVAPAASAFATFSFIGFFAALLPSLLADSLSEKSHLVAGGIVAAMFAIATVTVIVSRGLSSRSAMLAGVSLLLPSLALLVLAQLFAWMLLLLAGTAIGGVAAAFGYRGGLEVVNQIAPEERRAELVSSYFLACFIGNSLPVIGVGVLTMIAGSLVADTVFALVTALVAVTALLVGRRYLRTS